MLAFQPIASVKNPQIAAARELSARKGREARRAFLCEGEHLVMEALSCCPQAVESIFVAEEKQGKYASLLREWLAGSACQGSPADAQAAVLAAIQAVAQTAAQAVATQAAPAQGSAAVFQGCPANAQAAVPPALYAVPQRVMEALTQVKTPQGIAAVVRLPKPASLADLGPRLILLENVQDPGNVGTILRTLDAAGFDGCVLTPGCADPFAPKTLRATMGSVFRVPMAFVQAVPEALERLRQQSYALLSADLSGQPFYQRGPVPPRLCLMIGNEGAGLTPETIAAATHRFALPMAGGAESLNAAVAAAVMMYDLRWR